MTTGRKKQLDKIEKMLKETKTKIDLDVRIAEVQKYLSEEHDPLTEEELQDILQELEDVKNGKIRI